MSRERYQVQRACLSRDSSSPGGALSNLSTDRGLEKQPAHADWRVRLCNVLTH